MISGVTGPDAAKVNGRFEQVEREVYRKVGEPGLWLFVAKKGTWSVGATAGKDARKTESAGWAHSVALAGRMPPPVGTGQWHVHDDTKWAEQTLEVEVLDAAQAREWAEQVGAPAATAGPPAFLCTRSVLVLVFSVLTALTTCCGLCGGRRSRRRGRRRRRS